MAKKKRPLQTIGGSLLMAGGGAVAGMIAVRLFDRHFGSLIPSPPEGGSTGANDGQKQQQQQQQQPQAVVPSIPIPPLVIPMPTMAMPTMGFGTSPFGYGPPPSQVAQQQQLPPPSEPEEEFEEMPSEADRLWDEAVAEMEREIGVEL